MNLRRSITSTTWKMADWLFPPVCVGCGEPGQAICDVCKLSIDRLAAERCRLCAKPINHTGVCTNCRRNPPSFDQLYCYARYSGLIRKAIHQLKYGRDLGMGRSLANLITPDLKASVNQIDLIIPMPLSQERMKMRGYNQSAVITTQLAELTGRMHSLKVLRKIIDTESQVHLSVEERIANLDGAFEADPAMVSGKRILILDDVFTTGATMRQATKALKTAGADYIFAVTIARTLLVHV